MSYTITTDVFCDKCCDWIHGTTGGTILRRAAKAAAERAGWKFIKGEHICPRCAIANDKEID
jgi:hypothetical protein